MRAHLRNLLHPSCLCNRTISKSLLWLQMKICFLKEVFRIPYGIFLLSIYSLNLKLKLLSVKFPLERKKKWGLLASSKARLSRTAASSITATGLLTITTTAAILPKPAKACTCSLLSILFSMTTHLLG